MQSIVHEHPAKTALIIAGQINQERPELKIRTSGDRRGFLHLHFGDAPAALDYAQHTFDTLRKADYLQPLAHLALDHCRWTGWTVTVKAA